MSHAHALCGHRPLAHHPGRVRTLLTWTATLWGPASQSHWSPRALTPLITPGARGDPRRVTGTVPAGGGSERSHRATLSPTVASGRTRPLRLNGLKSNTAESHFRSHTGYRAGLRTVQPGQGTLRHTATPAGSRAPPDASKRTANVKEPGEEPGSSPQSRGLLTPSPDVPREQGDRTSHPKTLALRCALSLQELKTPHSSPKQRTVHSWENGTPALRLGVWPRPDPLGRCF